MEFLPGRGRYCEEEEVEMMGDMGSNKLPFSSSSASPSSSQYKGAYGSPRWGDRAAYYNQESLSFSQNIEFNNLRNKNPNEDQGIQGDPPSSGSGTGTGGDDHAVCIEREHMFDKVVTPGDVGKLNRLVIPKQHAEKYFPLDSSANEKGLLLSFEDRSGKPWRFRYSYWNSSQSYVMTKGWSRFVKEKKLYAGDIVSFERGAGETGKDRLFIDWRRRSDVQDHHHHQQRGPLPSLPVPYPLSLPGSVPWGRLVYPPTMNYDHSSHLRRASYDRASASSHYGYNVMNPGSGSVIYLSSPAQEQQYGMVQHSGGRDVPMVYSSVPVVHGKAAAKRLRLFGVNLECPTSEEDAECDIPTPIPNPTMGSNSFYPQLPQLPPPPPLQLRLYNSAPPPRTQSGSPPNMKSSMSLDLDI